MDSGVDDLLHLFVMTGFETVAPLPVYILLEQSGDGWHGHLAVAHHCHIGVDALVDFGTVDVEMDYLCLLGVGGGQTRHAVAEPHADGDEHVTLLFLQVGRIVAVHTEHTHVEGMSGGQCRESEQRACSRDVGFLEHLHQFVLCAGQLHALSH